MTEHYGPKGGLLRYGAAVAAVALATVARIAIDPWVDPGLVYATYIIAVTFAAWYGGLGPGLLALASGGIVARLVFLPRTAVLGRSELHIAVGMAVFLATGTVIVLLSEQNRRSRRRSESSEREAVRRHEWLRVTLMSIGDAVIATDAKGEIALINPSAEELTGWRPDEAGGRPVAEVFKTIDGATGAAMEDPVTCALREGRVVSQSDQTVLLARDGTRLSVLDTAAPIRDDENRLIGAVLVFRDVTEARRARDELRRALEVAEDASRAKDQFLAMLSHELRNPLTPVLMAADEMLADPATPLAHRESLELVRQNVALEVRLIDDLLDVMRIVRGKLPYRFELLDAHALLRRALATCRTDLRDKNLALELDEAAPEHHVQGDPARLQQVLWNLIKNAVKFTPSGGTIRVATGSADGKFFVEVVDNGVGIEASALPRIFNAFEQAEDATAGKFGGLGLGLAISRSIAEAHGGTLSAKSDGRDRGATFRLELVTVPAPIAAPPDPDADGTAADNGTDRDDLTGLRLLLVEDDPMTAHVMARLLRHAGYVVALAGTVAEASAVPIDDIDLIVSDLGLPDGSGLDLMRRIRSSSDVPAVALTGHGREDDIRRCLEAGFAAHLIKPVDFTGLDSIIRRVAREHGSRGTPARV